MTVTEIKASELHTDTFIADQVRAIQAAVGDGLAINALSGGVDSSAVTLLGHKALGDRLRTIFVQDGLMREDEPERVIGEATPKGLALVCRATVITARPYPAW